MKRNGLEKPSAEGLVDLDDRVDININTSNFSFSSLAKLQSLKFHACSLASFQSMLFWPADHTHCEYQSL